MFPCQIENLKTFLTKICHHLLLPSLSLSSEVVKVEFQASPQIRNQLADNDHGKDDEDEKERGTST